MKMMKFVKTQKKIRLGSFVVFFLSFLCLSVYFTPAYGEVIIASGETKTPADTGADAITVSDGGTFQINQSIDNTYSPITITGTGNGAIGAINVTGNTWQVYGNIVVDTSATVQTDSRTDMKGNLSGGILTKTGSAMFVMYGDTSTLDQIVISAGTYVAQSVNAINTTGGVQINGGTLQIWDTNGVKGTTITMAGGTLHSAGGSNSYLGDVVLTGAITLNAQTNLNIGGTITGGQNVSKTGSGTWNISNTATIGRLEVAEGAVTVLTGGVLTGTNMIMRDGDATGTYTLNINGGSVSLTSASSDNRLGHWSNHTGVINLTSGSLAISGSTNVGWDGTGKFYQSGGTSTFATMNMCRGNSLIEISGGTTSISTLNLGLRAGTTYGDTGAVTLKGTADVTIGNIYAYRKATINVQENASLHVTGSMMMGQNGDTAYTASINQTGGTVTVDGSLGLGHYPNAKGVYTISNGTLNVLNYDSANGQSGLWLAVDGNGEISQSGGTINAGRINLNARDNNNTGTLNLTGGKLNIGTGGIMATEAGSGRYVINLGGGTISSLEGTSWSSGLNATLTGTNGNTVFAPLEGQSITWNGTLSGDGGLVVNGNGTLKLAQSSNSYAGGTTVTAGELQLSGTNTGSSVVGTGTVTIESGAKVTASSANVFGAGDAANIPDVVINGGTLTPYQYLHLTNLTLTDGATVAYQGADTEGMGLDFSNRNGTITSTGATSIASRIRNGSTLTFDVESGTLSLTESVNTTTGNSVVKTGAGSLSTSSWLNTNVTIQEGDITITGDFGKGKRFNGILTVEAGAKLICATHDSLGYGSSTTNIYLNGGTLENSVGNETLNNTNIYLKGGTVTSTAAGATLDILNDGVNFYSQAKADATAENPTINVIDSSVKLRSNGTFEIDTAANSVLKMNKAIIYASGAGSITKTGEGVLEFSAANSYTGGTMINAGTLKLVGDGTIGSGALTLNGNAILDISEKTDPLSLSDLTLNSGNTLKVTINKDADGNLTCLDMLDLTGVFNAAGTLSIFLTGELLGLEDLGKVADVIDFGSYTGTFDSIVVDPDSLNKLGGDLFFTYNAANGTVQLSIPEPSTWALLILGAAGLLLFRRKK